MYHARALEVLGHPALNRASVIIFVIVCKVQSSVYFSCLLICVFSRERLFMSFMCVRLFIFYITKGLFKIFMKEMVFIFCKFTYTGYKS